MLFVSYLSGESRGRVRDREALTRSNDRALTKYNREAEYCTSIRNPNTLSDFDASRHYNANEGIRVAFLSLETRQRNLVRVWRHRK